MKNKGERGAISLLVIGTSLLIIVIVIAFTMNIENQKQVQKSEVNKITKSYEQNENKMEEVYQKAVNQNNN